MREVSSCCAPSSAWGSCSEFIFSSFRRRPRRPCAGVWRNVHAIRAKSAGSWLARAVAAGSSGLQQAQVEDGAHAHGLRFALDERHAVAGAQQPRLQHTQVTAAALGLGEGPDEVGQAHAMRQLVAGDARLADLQQGFAHAVNVADADLVFQQAADGEVLAELPGAQVVTAQLLRPPGVVLMRTGVDGLLRPAVVLQIRLAVALKVEPAQAHPPRYRLLVDAGAQRAAARGNRDRPADVDGEKFHALAPLRFTAAPRSRSRRGRPAASGPPRRRNGAGGSWVKYCA